MTSFHPEGVLMDTPENRGNRKSLITLQDSLANDKILEARAVVCDGDHNLIVDLGCIRGVIPREEGALGIREGITRDIAIISRVNKPVCFKVMGFAKDKDGKPCAVLSRKAAQQQCMEEYVRRLSPGDVIPAKVTHFEPFGCFVDIGCGIPSLIPIDAISVSRISHPADRFQIGQEIKAVVKSVEDSGKVCLSHKELLGTWEQNAANFHPGETVAGVVRSIENYGVFVELTPNLAGLAELRENVRVGQSASVYIKSLIPEKMKVKLIIVDSFDTDYDAGQLQYYFEGSHMDRWKYSPDCCEKVIGTQF